MTRWPVVVFSPIVPHLSEFEKAIVENRMKLFLIVAVRSIIAAVPPRRYQPGRAGRHYGTNAAAETTPACQQPGANRAKAKSRHEPQAANRGPWIHGTRCVTPKDSSDKTEKRS